MNVRIKKEAKGDEVMAFNYYETPIGILRIEATDKAISQVSSCSFQEYQAMDKSQCEESPLIVQAKKELDEYFQGERFSFSLPLALKGTNFQQKIWQELRKIPYGATCSYGELAKRSGSPKGARAAGMACNRNSLLIFVPCHRVIGKDQTLTGFGAGLNTKRTLLSLEGIQWKE